MTLTELESLRLDYAEPLHRPGCVGGTQWVLRKAIPGHPKFSTVAQSTLDAAIIRAHPVSSSDGKIVEFAQLRDTLQ